MRVGWIGAALVAAVSVAGSSAGFAQTPQSEAASAAAAAEEVSRAAPVRDLTGIWFKRNPPGVRTFSGAEWTPGEAPPLSAWGLEEAAKNRPNNTGEFNLDETNDPVLTKCYPPGVPRIYFHPYPFEIIQIPSAVLQIFEYDHFLRRLWTDGRELPDDPDPLWMGTSVGRWLDDYTFQVVTVGFNGKTWLDRAGTPHSDQLKVTETFRRTAFDRLELDVVMEDPKALAKPWVAHTGYYELRPNWELGEISCSGDYLDWPGA